MKRRWLVVLIPLAGGVAGAAACSFPDVTFVPDGPAGIDSGGDSTVTPQDGAVDGEGGTPVNPDVDPEGGARDATTVPDGAQRIDAGPDAQCCDCDIDLVNVDRADCPLTGPARDCDDFSEFVKPGQDFVNSDVWDSPHMPKYDWDCSGVVVKQYAYGLTGCADKTKLSGCGNYQGAFVGNPGCGVSAKYITSCIADGNILNLNCTEQASDTRKQGCR